METIAAISTPPGRGGISVIRISGDRSIEIADSMFRKGPLPSKQESHKVIHGEIFDGEAIDEVLLTVMRAPKTYTGEDVVEISCHGGNVTANLILKTMLKRGARLAEPGEFTRRAFLNGKIDLIQAEAIADIVNARTVKAQRYALSSIKGELSDKINQIKKSLGDIQILIEASLNFPDDVYINDKDIRKGITIALSEVNFLLDGARYCRFIRDGVSIPIIGRTNVGKSSLFNRILTNERAIVTPIPGTTRDIIEATTEIAGVLVMLMDTCGIRTSRDEVEVEGIKRARKVLDEADIVLWVIDQSQPLNDEDYDFLDLLKGKNTIAVLNKCDISRDGSYDVPYRKVSVSAKTGENIQRLLDMLKDDFSSVSSDIFMLRERHLDILNRVSKNLQDSLIAETLELTATDISYAIECLREMIGETTNPSVIDSIFSKFCIGK